MPGPGFLIASLLKILRIRLPARMAVPYPERLLVREPSGLPEGVYARLVPFIAPCEREGLRSKFFYEEPLISPDVRVLGVALLSDDHLTYGFLAESETRNAAGIQRRIDLSLITPLSNGRMICTRRSGRNLDAAPELETEALAEPPVERVLERHRERLRALRGAVHPVPIEGRLEEFILKIGRLTFDSLVRRGVFVPISDAEVEKLKAAKSRPMLNAILLWLAIFMVVYFSTRSCGS